VKRSRFPGAECVAGEVPRLTRRQTLAGIATVGLGLTLASRCALATMHDGGQAPASRALTLHNTHTLETLSIDYCARGAYVGAALDSINYALRDHRTGDVHAIDPALLDLLHAVAMRADREPEFEVISGYRSPRTNAVLHERSSGVASHSLHMEGRAIDIRLVGLDVARTRDIGLELGRGGVGYYRASAFVHLDTGRQRTWSG